MNRNKHILFLLPILALASCQLLGQKSSGEFNTIKNGYSFGECTGICKGDLIITQSTKTLSLSEWFSSDPDVSYQDALSSQEWSSLQNAIDLEAFCRMDEVYGCPDCNDGGAEYVTLACDGTEKTVTFEYGTTDLEEINALLEIIRPLRIDLEPDDRF